MVTFHIDTELLDKTVAEIQNIQSDFGIELTDKVLLSFKHNVESVAKGKFVLLI